MALVVLLGLAMTAVPVMAEARDQQAWSLSDVLELGGKALTEAIAEALAEIENHVEIQGRSEPGGQEGEQVTRLDVTLFPKGKQHREEQLGAQLHLEYSLAPDRPHLHFDLRIRPRWHADEYL